MVWEGKDVVATGQKLIGATNPLASEHGTIHGDFAIALEEGYYRRGAAHLAMGKFKEALKDLQQVKKMCPNDTDASKKLKECEKAVMKLKFEEAIAVPEHQGRPIADSIDFHSIGRAN
ncbi:serine/threonine-protein phosphatase 5 isoform X2 [Arachis duranensis]|uniref:Serine/threonine-protein phosphatase 5 isoform X2 n=1 Tax=Arachis duranensis TaxID=130453 RepID=A0A9C6TJS8_ARADU|nr:serine/threonine-protein phosphatase 5 isoform X2 [Arachis duranensis]